MELGAKVAAHVGPVTLLHVLVERARANGAGMLGGDDKERALVFEWLGKLSEIGVCGKLLFDLSVTPEDIYSMGEVH